ncbi:hypothetical protein [Jiangella asiatica]|uniref:Glycosyl hydrolase family 32 N-terminal domain-containing protein n=1 Tax=Jiangella asiatica TaxID=2530372 RepID=A0A4R5CJ14_9ACTN|nr:hypothetical protein [Jiangella asiatica]TDE00212.1 hypothetical protein E1269_26225 [Jiangella asiatica]
MSEAAGHRVLSPFPPFGPERGVVVRPPEIAESGYWSGCPGILRDGDRFLLTYRQRRPRGTERERGWRCAIAESDDGVTFRDIWAVEKEELSTASMERCSLLPMGDGYLLYLSYVDPDDNRWRIDVMDADTPAGFSVSKAEPVLTAATTGTEGVKDPYAWRIGPAVYLFASYAEAQTLTQEQRARAHATSDIYNTGVTTHPTGLATSTDGRAFDWHGQVLGVGTEWDRYQARLNTILPLGGAYLGFYDGSAGADENYEERTGLALSFDLEHWRRLTPHRPWVTTSQGSGSVRYLDAVTVDDEWWLYYEMTRADGAHELRMSRVPRS